MSRKLGLFVEEITAIKAAIQGEDDTTFQSIKERIECEIQQRLTSLLRESEPVFTAVLPLHDDNQTKIEVIQYRTDLTELIEKNPDYDRQNMLCLKINGAVEKINAGHDPHTPLEGYGSLLWEVVLLYAVCGEIPGEI